MSELLAQSKWLVSVGIVVRSCMTLTVLISINSSSLALKLSDLDWGYSSSSYPNIPDSIRGNFLCLVRVLWAPMYAACTHHGMGLLPLPWYKLEVSSHHVHPQKVMSHHYKPNTRSILMSIFLFSSAHREITGAGKWNLCSVACFCHLCPSSYWHKGIYFLLKLPHGYPVLVHALRVKFAPMEFHVTLVSVLLVCQLKNST